MVDIYQSNGACSDTCKARFAFAVLKGNECWCSNYVPGNQDNTGSCNTDCPGYPTEKCGNPSQNLYGYILVGDQGNVAGTKSLSTAAPTTQVSDLPPIPPQAYICRTLLLHIIALLLLRLHRSRQEASPPWPPLLTIARRLLRILIP